MKLTHKLFNSSLLAALFFSVAASTSPAVSLFLTPSSQAISVGANTSVDLTVGGLGNTLSPALGGWAAMITYDPSVVSFDGGTFGSELDTGGFGSLQADLSVPGTISFDEISFESPADLIASQADTFVLATFNFSGLAPGSSPLTFQGVPTATALSDELGNALQFQHTDGVIRVIGGGGNQVPDSGSTFLLFGAGVLCISRLQKVLLHRRAR